MKQVLIFISRLFSNLPFLKKVDGYKTILGIVLIAVYYAMQFLGDVASHYPGLLDFMKYQSMLLDLKEALEYLFEVLGWPLIAVGLTCKAGKRLDNA